MAVTIEKDFTAAGQVSIANNPKAGGTLRAVVEGTFVGTVVLERSRDNGISYQQVGSPITGAFDTTYLVEDPASQSVQFRFRCTAYTSGTIETSTVGTDPAASGGGGGGGSTAFADLTGSPSDNAALDAELDGKADDPVDLTAGVTGVLPIANGGTNSSTALGGGGKAIVSDATKIIEHATVTAVEVGHLAGVSSAIQTQLDAKAPLDSPAFTTKTTHSYATASRAAIFNASKELVHSAVTDTELGYLSGVSSSIQTQLGTKLGGALGATDNAILRADGTGGATAQGSAVTMADTTGIIRFPTDGGLEFNGAANPSIKSLTSFEAGTLLSNTGATNRSHFWQVNSVTKFGITNSDTQVYGSIYNVGSGRFGYTSESSLPTPFGHSYFQQMWVDEGTNKSQGLATLVGGTVTVNTTQILTGDRVAFWAQTPGGTQGHLSLGTITNATSFVINSSSGTDTSTVFWMIFHPY